MTRHIALVLSATAQILVFGREISVDPEVANKVEKRYSP